MYVYHYDLSRNVVSCSVSNITSYSWLAYRLESLPWLGKKQKGSQILLCSFVLSLFSPLGFLFCLYLRQSSHLKLCDLTISASFLLCGCETLWIFILFGNCCINKTPLTWLNIAPGLYVCIPGLICTPADIMADRVSSQIWIILFAAQLKGVFLLLFLWCRTHMTLHLFSQWTMLQWTL